MNILKHRDILATLDKIMKRKTYITPFEGPKQIVKIDDKAMYNAIRDSQENLYATLEINYKSNLTSAPFDLSRIRDMLNRYYKYGMKL